MDLKLVGLSAALCALLAASQSVGAEGSSQKTSDKAEPYHLVCDHIEGSIDGPFVPDSTVARQIFIAVGNVIEPGFLTNKNSKIRVDDKGPHWVVTQIYWIKESGGKTVQLMGGAGFSVVIDKCTGAVVAAKFNR